MFNRNLFSTGNIHCSTPKEFYNELDKEFHFNDDPCPLHSQTDGLSRAWGSSVFCNPPYGTAIGKWIKKGYDESLKGSTVVMLLPSRTDTKWWHEYCMKGEIRFIRGRLKFGGSKNNAPFPSVIVIFKQDGSHAG